MSVKLVAHTLNVGVTLVVGGIGLVLAGCVDKLLNCSVKDVVFYSEVYESVLR